MTYVLIVSSAIAAILLFLLAAASANTALFARHYPLLVELNSIVALALVCIVAYQLWQLVRAVRHRVFGSRLTLRLLLLFALMALIPGALVYTVSVQFLAKSIESWFDVRVDNALEGGLNLGRAALDSRLEDLNMRALDMAVELSEIGASQQSTMLDRLRERAGADEALIIGGSGVVAMASRDLTTLMPAAPGAAIVRQARQNRGFRAIETSGDRGMSLRVIVPVGRVSLGEEQRLLQLTQAVPANLAASAEAVQGVYRSYKELSLARQGLKKIYILVLSLALLLALFSALALALLLSRRLSDPLATLAAATQAVARGDFSQRARVSSADELGTLTRSFNSMTEQLDDARRAAERNRVQVESAKAHLESVLANLSAGVLVFDQDMHLRIANASAGRLIDATGEQGSGTIDEALEARLRPVIDLARQAFNESKESSWQREMNLADGARVLVLRGSRLPQERGGDFVVVFDEVTAIVQAQRATAWAEVAQRLAHEIKNPLTPIQLAAERLRAKLGARLAPEDNQVLVRSTDTIVAQVGEMKRMVDEFREYARLPTPKLVALDLNVVIADVLTLYEHGSPGVHTRMARGLPPIQGDASLLRQVIHNLLQNAQDASSAQPDAFIEVATEAREGKVLLTVRDQGSGFPENVLRRALEPYVTSKPKGTGLGLAIVKKIVDEHHGSVQIANAPDRGAVITIALPLAEAGVAQPA